jgi:hypothetical protein
MPKKSRSVGDVSAENFLPWNFPQETFRAMLVIWVDNFVWQQFNLDSFLQFS